MRRIAVLFLAALPAAALGDPRPSLGVQTANPSHDRLAPHLAIPIGVAERPRCTDGTGLERRTTVSVAAVARAFPKGIRHHAQFDFIRLKHTGWDAAQAWTVSTGDRRLPRGIDTLLDWLR